MKEFEGTPGPWSIDEYGIMKDKNHETIMIKGVAVPCGNNKGGKDNAQLVAASPELLAALQWALPLAQMAMEEARMWRVKAGHMDIKGTYNNGETWVGIYQEEVDQIERARFAIKKALGEIGYVE